MGDLIRIRLTGLFRDEEPDAFDLDPGCEAQFEDLDDPTVLKTVRVTFANNCPAPWYAVMAHFYGTVRCVTGSMTIPSVGTYRTYEVNSDDRAAVVTALGIRSADGTGLVCLEIPADATFHGIVLGRTQPQLGDESLPGASAVTTWGNWGSLPVPCDAWCRLVFVAPDGSNYGTAMDGSRWIFGYYPGIRSFVGGVPETPTSQDNLSYGQPALQYGSNVTLSARRYDLKAEFAAFQTRLAWHVVPGEAPPANIVMARKGTDDWGLAHEEFDATQTYDHPCIVAWDPTRLMWRKATVQGSGYSARTSRTLLGICIGSNGSLGSVSLAQRFVVTEGRFWLNPMLHALFENTPYYIATTASESSPATQGTWDITPCTKGCRRVAFTHHTEGWCTVGPQYDGGTLATEQVVVQSSHGFVAGDPIRPNGSSWVKSTADTAANAVVDSIVTEVIDIDTFVKVTSGYVEGMPALTAGAVHYLGLTGGLTTTAPTIAIPVLLADTTSTGTLMSRWMGGGESEIEITQALHGFAAGTPVYYDSLLSGLWLKSMADTEAHCKVHGVVNRVVSTGVFTVKNGGVVGGSYLPGRVYYVSTAGGGDYTPPTGGKPVLPYGVSLDGSRLLLLTAEQIQATTEGTVLCRLPGQEAATFTAAPRVRRNSVDFELCSVANIVTTPTAPTETAVKGQLHFIY